MADYDKDGDAIMTPQHITENEELPQQLATTASRRVNRAVQNSTDTGAISPSRVIEDPQNVPTQNSTPLLPPRPVQVPFDHQLPVDSEDFGKAHQLTKNKPVHDSEEEAWAREQSSKKLEEALREIRRLNTIIFRIGMPKAEPLDTELLAQFCGIRDSLFGLVRAHFEAHSVALRNLSKKPSNIAEGQKYWLGQWNHDSSELRIYRVQGAMFDIINRIFFAKLIFPVESAMEEQLRYFEHGLELSPKISKIDVVEWRKRTVTAAKALNIPCKKAERATRKILETLEPARTPGPISQAKDQQLSRDLLAICDKASQLSLIFRESKAIFKIVVPYSDVDVLADNPEMELIAMEDGRNPPRRPRVLFTAFGGLEKTVLSPDGRENVVRLEKAHVVGYEAQASRSGDYTR